MKPAVYFALCSVKVRLTLGAVEGVEAPPHSSRLVEQPLNSLHRAVDVKIPADAR